MYPMSRLVTICPVEHDPSGETLRAGLISAGIETEANQLMIANIRTYGNPSPLPRASYLKR